MDYQVSSLFNTRILFCDSNGKYVELCPTGQYRWEPGQVLCKSLQKITVYNHKTRNDDVVGYVAHMNGWWTSIAWSLSGHNAQIGKKERSRDVAIAVILDYVKSNG